jgi:hypothetical protein
MTKKSDIMNTFGITFHHFGLAVQSPEQAFSFLDALGYKHGESMFDPLQGVNLAMSYHAEMPDVEVIWPGDKPSPIDGILKRQDSMIYHLCYTSDNPALSLTKMQQAGFDVLPVSNPQAAILFGGRKVSFHMVLGFGLIELIYPIKE